MKPEERVKRIVKSALDKRGIYYYSVTETIYGKSTLDFLCCINEVFVAIETKAEGKHPTKRQEKSAKDIERNGGIVLVVTGEKAARELADRIKTYDGHSRPFALQSSFGIIYRHLK